MKQLLGQLLAVSVLALTSLPSSALDLEQIYQLAAQQDAQLKIAASRLESAQQALPQATSANRPQVNLNAGAQYKDSQNAPSAGDDTTTSLSYGVTLQQNLYNREIDARIEAAEASVEQFQADYDAAAQDLMVRVTEAYFAILSAQDNLDFAQAEKNAIGRQLEQAKKRFEVGLIAITDVKEAQASYDLSVSQEIIARNGLDNAREALHLIIGEPLTEPLAVLGDALDLSIPEPSSASSWVEKALKSNPNLHSAQAALKAASKNRDIARAETSPSVVFSAGYQGANIDSDRAGSFDTSDLSLGVQLNMPLYTGGRTDGAIAQAEADYNTAANNLLLQKRLAAQQTSTAYLAVVSGIGQVNALKQALVSTTAALEATEAGFDVGTRTSVDVLNSLRETYRSRRDYASARYDYLSNTLKLKQAAGTLNDQDLTDVNRWLQGPKR
jgi:outer membrane protein